MEMSVQHVHTASSVSQLPIPNAKATRRRECIDHKTTPASSHHRCSWYRLVIYFGVTPGHLGYIPWPLEEDCSQDQRSKHILLSKHRWFDFRCQWPDIKNTSHCSLLFSSGVLWPGISDIVFLFQRTASWCPSPRLQLNCHGCMPVLINIAPMSTSSTWSW